MINKKYKMEELEIKNETESNKRPPLLTLLCVLTFISSGLENMFSLIIPLFPDEMVQFIKNSPGYDEVGMSYVLKIIFTACSLVGAILMWKLKKIGFHFYSLSNLALLFIPTLLLGMSISSLAIILTICYIALYAMNLKFMK
jgi:hypothetical protein